MGNVQSANDAVEYVDQLGNIDDPEVKERILMCLGSDAIRMMFSANEVPSSTPITLIVPSSNSQEITNKNIVDIRLHFLLYHHTRLMKHALPKAFDMKQKPKVIGRGIFQQQNRFAITSFISPYPTSDIGAGSMLMLLIMLKMHYLKPPFGQYCVLGNIDLVGGSRYESRFKIWANAACILNPFGPNCPILFENDAEPPQINIIDKEIALQKWGVPFNTMICTSFHTLKVAKSPSKHVLKASRNDTLDAMNWKKCDPKKLIKKLEHKMRIPKTSHLKLTLLGQPDLYEIAYLYSRRGQFRRGLKCFKLCRKRMGNDVNVIDMLKEFKVMWWIWNIQNKLKNEESVGFPVPIAICGGCGAKGHDIVRCSCSSCDQMYCSRRCQKRHWVRGNHKIQCPGKTKVSLVSVPQF